VAQVGWLAYAHSFMLTTYRSFWGQFGWMAVPMDSRTYRLLATLSLLATSGLLLFLLGQWRKWDTLLLTTEQWLMLATLALSVLFSGLAYGWYNLSFVQFQGRYLFSSIIPLAVFLAMGLRTILEMRWCWLLTGLLAAATAGLAIASWQGGGLDKWGSLMMSALLALASARIFLPRYQTVLATVLLVSWYGALALLALLSPTWFILPYL
jgi:hypothetical protein